jgi:hypothetical protein
MESTAMKILAHAQERAAKLRNRAAGSEWQANALGEGDPRRADELREAALGYVQAAERIERCK